MAPSELEQTHDEFRCRWRCRITSGVLSRLNPEHVVYRTAEPDDPARLRVSLPEDDMSRSLEATFWKGIWNCFTISSGRIGP